jgi:hypothetical protein
MSCDNREELHTRNSFNLKKVLNTEKILVWNSLARDSLSWFMKRLEKEKKIYFCMNLLVCMIATCLSKDQEIVLEQTPFSNALQKHESKYTG